MRESETLQTGAMEAGLEYTRNKTGALAVRVCRLAAHSTGSYGMVRVAPLLQHGGQPAVGLDGQDMATWEPTQGFRSLMEGGRARAEVDQTAACRLWLIWRYWLTGFRLHVGGRSLWRCEMWCVWLPKGQSQRTREGPRCCRPPQQPCQSADPG
ncbi:uncharacterized protein B0I36DRAFT_315235 [Microdochium trichocladiopsis]|uniref:Uncharacterized protein n=1 Tax=Microdochium trichocladiopsis TaxID=1682393 RepID=A0A9P8YHD7_9PEZI|nr:uncharacterized protein B0I36DRAFT_315235 [Microdochium trichocladiopsis]KAH7037989.1 hypothetical protein B0I36DRAFT_315235 [Microdochium trichocladiopsis]